LLRRRDPGFGPAQQQEIVVTLDNHDVALDSKSGRKPWVTKTGDINLDETATAAPFVVKDQVFV
jgi:hypothetical protein